MGGSNSIGARGRRPTPKPNPINNTFTQQGATGCGKTSLLNCLSGRVQFVRGAKLTGRLLTNGAPRDQAEFANISAYVTQDDHLYPQLVRML